MNRRVRNRNTFLETLKDYAVPIVGFLLIIILIYSIFGGSKEGNDQNNIQNIGTEQSSYLATFSQANTQAQVIYSGGGREDISENTEIFPGETVVVQEGKVRLTRDENQDIHLNRIAEFKIDAAGKYALFSSDAWISTSDPSTITMRYATVTASRDTIVSLTQNEAGSTVYVLKGSAQVENMVGVQTRVIAGQRISIPRLQASNRDFDISSERNSIDAFFQNSDWFLDNDGHLIQIEENGVNDSEDEGNITGENGEQSSGSSSSFIRFDRLRDEMSVESSNINISGTLLSENIGAISIQNTPVDIDIAARSFSLDNIRLPQAMNDLVIKIYDSERNILRKEVITVYTSSPSESNGSISQDTNQSSSNNQQTQASGGQGNTHFDVDASKFVFTSPSATGRFTTSSSEVTIRGQTTAEGITRVEVNGFELNSFNGSTWRYHAFERFDTIREGTNQYRIDYFDANNRLVYTDYFTIIKQAPGATPTAPPTNEAQNNSTNPQQAEESNSPEQNTDVPLEPESLFGN
ncbi:hypothetical protein LAT59_03080 [Candidatus Gracilibacteria bacterium]|nr:hypothetical protein [Candidatus Gracilibacteria bacterium]